MNKLLDSLLKFSLVAMLFLSFLSVAAEAQGKGQFVVSPDSAKRSKVRDEISLDTARRIAEACFKEAESKKMGVSIFIINPTGQIVYALRSDGQAPVNVETALMKAKTALFMRDSTHAWQNRMSQDPDFATRLMPLGQFFNSGGLPVIVDDVLIGAIGVGGMAPTAEWSDEICAHRAMTAVLGPQPPLAPFLPARPASR
jgi:uncharacterized protein GlcG (DUF336 family)